MRKKPELPDVEPVHLNPVFGIRPGVVILSAIIVSILLIAFLLFVLPGIVQKGGYARFVTNTSDTAIYSEDGKYIGSSEGSVYYVPHGENTFHFAVKGADAGSITVDIPHRIFFTLFSHRITDIEFNVENTEEIERAVKQSFASDVSSWSEVIDYDDIYHYPPLFQHFARNASALGFETVEDEILYGAMHITSEEMEADFLASLDILSSSSVRYITAELESIIDKKADAIPKDIVKPVSAPSKEGHFFRYAETELTMGNNESTAFPEANERMVNVSVPEFAIASRPVSEYDYALFVEANPYWSAGNKDNLIADGVVDEGYLDGITLSTKVRSSLPIRNISYYAAEAYTRWLSDRDGISYVIPTEAEWTVAAYSAEHKPYASSLVPIETDDSTPSFMLGQLWEMTSTPYIPLMRLYGYDKALSLGSLYPFDDIIVKGGSYINDPSSITADTVGAFSRSSTSEYVTLRVGIEYGNQVNTEK